MGLRGRNATPLNVPSFGMAGQRLDVVDRRSRAQKVIDFIETLPVTSGTLAGTKFKLREWQKKIIRSIYKTKGKNSRRVVRTALITMPRKQGKTALTACLALCHLCGPESEDRGAVYSAAADRNQASLVFNEMRAMVQQKDDLKGRIIIRDFTKDMRDVITDSTFQALSADANTKYGFSASCIIYDELAQAPNRALYDALATSTGARKEPLMIVISTQSSDPHHIMSELVDYGIQLQDGVVSDESFYAFIKSAPESADPWDESTWFDCNPALDDFRSLEEMRSSALQAQRIPAREATFRLLYLNQRIQAEHRAVPRADWDACARDFKLADLKGQPCYGGLDLSSTGKNDLTSLVLVFPMDDKKIVLPVFWACEGGLEEAESRDRVPLRLWARQGHLKAIPGRVMDYAFIAQAVKEMTADYDLQCIAFDQWKIKQFIQECDKIGANLTMTAHGQSFKDMDPSIQAFVDDVLSWRLVHNNNPVLNWCVDNVKIEQDAAGNQRFNKRKSTGRIDGAVALAMACGLAKVSKPKEAQFQAFVL